MTRWKRHHLLEGGACAKLLWLLSMWLCLEGTTGSARAQFENEPPVACLRSVTPPSPKVGEQVTISGICSYDPDGVVFQYQWTFSDGQAAYTGSEASVTRTFSNAGTYAVFLRVKDNDGAWSSKIKKNITVTANNFTVNIIPSAGCAVMAGDGGVDAAEANGNGIACSGGMAANDPLCAEQFNAADIAALKAVPEAGYGFTGWIVDGAHIQMTSAEPLFLSTRPALADNGANVQVKNGCTETQADCQKQTVYLTFDDGPLGGTDDVLRILEAEGVKGTFLMVGFHTYVINKGQLSESPWRKEQVQKAYSNQALFLVGNHSWLHPDNGFYPTKNLTWYYAPEQATEVLKDYDHNDERLSEVIGIAKTQFVFSRLPGKDTWRLPGDPPDNDGSGAEAADLLAQHGYQIYGWDGVEWKFYPDGNNGRRPAETADDVFKKIKPAFETSRKKNKVILLMHDDMFRNSNGDDVKLQQLIQLLKGKGYEFDLLSHYAN